MYCISSFSQVRFESWSSEIFQPQKQALSIQDITVVVYKNEGPQGLYITWSWSVQLVLYFVWQHTEQHKGGATVVWHKDLTIEAERQISDLSAYRPVDHDLHVTEEHQTLMSNTINTFICDGDLPKKAMTLIVNKPTCRTASYMYPRSTILITLATISYRLATELM